MRRVPSWLAEVTAKMIPSIFPEGRGAPFLSVSDSRRGVDKTEEVLKLKVGYNVVSARDKNIHGADYRVNHLLCLSRLQ